MSDFHAAWALSRQRLLSEVKGLSTEQLNWRLHPASLTIGEMVLHVAGVEVSFATQLSGTSPEGEAIRLKAAATDGVVNDKEFPFSPAEVTPEFLDRSLDLAQTLWEPLIAYPSAELRATEIVSALGPVIDGNGAFARLSFHAAYHQGQVYLIKTAPGFPAA